MENSSTPETELDNLLLKDKSTEDVLFERTKEKFYQEGAKELEIRVRLIKNEANKE